MHTSTPLSLLKKTPFPVLMGMIVGVSLILAFVVMASVRNSDTNLLSKADTSSSCNTTLSVSPSGCGMPCGNDTHCQSGFTCYRAPGVAATVDGVCRLLGNPRSSLCTPVQTN